MQTELDIINRRFNYQLQMQIDGVLPEKFIYKFGMPSDILLSAGIPNFPIELSAQRLFDKSKQENHEFEIKDIKNLPQAINEPMAVFESTKKDGSKVILTELNDGKSNFVAILRIRKDDNKNIEAEINSVRSLYPKSNIEGILDWINSKDNLLRYTQKEKTLAFISTQSTNLIAGGNENKSIQATKLQQKIELAKKKVTNFQNPKINTNTNLKNITTMKEEQKELNQEFDVKDLSPINFSIYGEPENKITYQMCKDAINNIGGYELQFVPEVHKTEELCRMAVVVEPFAIAHVPKKLLTTELCMIAVKAGSNNSRLFEKGYIPEELQTVEMAKIAVENNPYNFHHIADDCKTYSMCVNALLDLDKSPYPVFMSEIPEKFRDINMCYELIKSDRSFAVANIIPTFKIGDKEIKPQDFVDMVKGKTLNFENVQSKDGTTKNISVRFDKEGKLKITPPIKQSITSKIVETVKEAVQPKKKKGVGF